MTRQEIRTEMTINEKWAADLYDWAWHCVAEYFTHK